MNAARRRSPFARPCVLMAKGGGFLLGLCLLGLPLWADGPEDAARGEDAGQGFTAMPPSPKGPEEYLNKWDPFVIGPLTGAKETLSLPNGRQIARDSTGMWFVLLEKDGAFLYLGMARGDRVVGGDFKTIDLAGKSDSAVFPAKGRIAGASMVMDGSDTLHIVWCDSSALLYAKRSVKGIAPAELSRRDAWEQPTTLAEPACEPGDIMLDRNGTPTVCYSRDDTVYYLPLTPGAKPEPAGGVAAGMASLVEPKSDQKAMPEKDPAAPMAPKPKTPSWPPPRPIQERRCQEAVMDLGRDGTVHLAFRRDFDIWYALRTPDGQWRAPERAAWGLAFHPSIVTAGDRPLICFQSEGMKKATLGGPEYIREREGGGASIGYAVRTHDGWRTGYVAKAEETIVNRQGIWEKRFEGRLLPMVEEMWRPALFRDRHDVPWVLWQNTTRRWAYSARWLGDGFGEIQECRGPFNAPGQPVSAEKRMPPGATDVGLLFFAAHRVIFDRLKIPTLSLDEEREVLFLDALEIGAASGVDFVVNPTTKHPANPVLSPGPLGSKDDRDVHGVRVYKHGNVYVMYYGYRSWTDRPWRSGAIAVSANGVTWQRVDKLPSDLPPRDPDGKPSTPLDRGYFDNPDSSAPARKYMRVSSFGPVWHQGSKRVVYSPDGKTWNDGPEVSVLNGLYEGAEPNLWDTLDVPERRIKTYGRIYTTNSRSCGMMWTKDLVHWHGAEHFLDPDDPYGKPPAATSQGPLRGQVFLDACAGKGEDQIYSARVSIVEGIYFCTYWPCRFDHRYETALAVSRDGFNFTRVKNGSRTLSVGPAGAWDNGIVCWNEPLRDGDTLKEYYSGAAWHHGTEPYAPSRRIGLATIRVNGWTYYTAAPDGFVGTVTTIPILAPTGLKRALTVNVEGIAGRKDAFLAEALDAETGASLPGFSASDCRPIESDGLAARVGWTRGDALPASRPIRLRFHLRGEGVRLYSFAFRNL